MAVKTDQDQKTTLNPGFNLYNEESSGVFSLILIFIL